MLKGIRSLSYIGAAVVVASSFFACQSGLGTKAAQGQEASVLDTVTPVILQDTSPIANGRLAKRLKDPIAVPVDTLNPISKDSIARYVKQERRRIRDSVRTELNKRPKHIYFTFDDGPLKGSAAIDSIAKSKNIKISVFLVGKHANMSKGLKRDFEKYNNNPLVECYNHSYTHANNRFVTFYSNPVSAYEDFEKNETDLALKHKIVRLPGRNIWIYDDVRRIDLQSGASTADMLYSNGYKVYGWDVEWKINGLTGTPVQSVQEVYSRLTNYMNNKTSMEANNVVLLMHDDMFQNKKGQQLLSSLIDSIQKNTDYKFEFIRDYPFRY
ncbi:polysaccharide deacetylase family protein [Sphingobacterium wenxiniae]|uniref:Peptidoglycan/xylan/chitin deacetylase, PgdA/CDA1 family n=1 Tax=Sphingobacterium wenxiniae TaxID=683125 RepID=A0A1I6QNJ3_9SPHI|nr:polysaccharide deacetylase family protein [Sphingobacterium wenxiniae]SFS53898.1 Peptidoglycan/xylan/chitin deacetylase, PgdA/CDA1 family [Sphingobacterium wenxiniae]